jgi:hypothetical protein
MMSILTFLPRAEIEAQRRRWAFYEIIPWRETWAEPSGLIVMSWNGIVERGMGFSMTRDRILTEKVIRGCWHEWPEKPTPLFQSGSDLCKKCGGFKGMVGSVDFSGWKGFGELWEQLRQRKYWGAFWQWLTQRYLWQEWESKNPSQRADVNFEFGKEKGELLEKEQA